MSNITADEEKQGEQANRVTQIDVAARAGVSPAVVSYVINNGPRQVSEKTRQRVLKAIEELDYRPNVYAQRLMRAGWGSDPAELQVGVLLGGGSSLLERPYYGSILSGIYQEAKRQGRRIRFVYFHEDIEDPNLFNELVNPDTVSGIILLSGVLHLDTPEGQQLLQRTISRVPRVVTIGRRPEGVIGVQFDLSEAARKAVNHLIQLDHYQIGYIGNPDRRYRGYNQAMLEAGLNISHDMVIHSTNLAHSVEAGYHGARQLMSLPNRPTAIFGGSDDIALGAIRALNELGLRVPHDIAIVGVNDLDWAAFTTPSLTTVRLPREAMGIYAVRMLVELTTRPEEPHVSIVLPTELVIRESCGYHLKHQTE